MDNSLDEAFGNQQRPRTDVEAAWHTEQSRKQYDIIRVANPSHGTVKGIGYDFPQEDFYVKYDIQQYQKIPANSERDIPRFRAERYVEHMKDKWVNFVAKKMHDDYLADRDRKGLPKYTDKSTENKETYETEPYPKTNDATLIAEIYNQLWVGLVNKAGSDVPPEMGARAGEVDQTPTSRKVLDSLAGKVISNANAPTVVTDTPPPPPSPFATMNQKLAPEEVTLND